MRELLRQVLVHGLITALAVQALLRAWRLGDPAQRLRLRLLGLLLPLVVTPALAWTAPFREALPFRDEAILLDTRRYPELRLLGLPADEWVILALGATGVTLLLRDLLPLALERLLRRREAPLLEPPDALRAAVEELAAGLGLANLPRVRLLDSERPSLACSGLAHPTLIVSSGALRLLTLDELRAGLAHELAHVLRRDTLLGWLLMGLRVLLVTNPAAQLLARAAVQDVEARADDVASALTHAPLALAASLVKVFRRSGSLAPTFAGSMPALDRGGVLGRLRTEALERRCRRLIDGVPARRLRLEALHLAGAAAGLTGILFLVV
jgi:Zn-dependent protease with chaperone function